MDEDATVLTSYFRERERAGVRFPGGALIDACSRSPVAASVLLRCVDGYGPGRPAGPGYAPPPAEDPPLTAVAVGTTPRIDALIGELAGLAGPPLMTLERTRLLTGDIDPLWLGESATEATRLTIYCGQADRVYQVPAFEAACELLYRRGIAGATVLPGIDGTVGGRRQRAQLLRREAGPPLLVVAVGAGDRIGMLLPDLGGMFRHPVMTIARVRLCKRDGQLISRPAAPPGAAAVPPAGLTTLLRLTVYTSEAARQDGQPVHRALVRRMRLAGIGGATSQRGSWGFHGDHAPHGDHFPRPGRHVPVVTTIIDTPERIAVAFDVIDALTPGRCLVTAETVLTPLPAAVRTGQGS